MGDVRVALFSFQLFPKGSDFVRETDKVKGLQPLLVLSKLACVFLESSIALGGGLRSTAHGSTFVDGLNFAQHYGQMLFAFCVVGREK